MFIDTHCHLQFQQFDEDREVVIQRAIQNEIDGMLTIGTDLKSSRDAIALSKKFAVIFASVGIHPNDSSQMDISQINQLKNMTEGKNSVAIGEIGLDYYRMVSPKETQQHLFKQQLKLAKELDDGKSSDSSSANGETTLEERVFSTSAAVAPVLLPMIESLGALTEEQVAVGGQIGDDE